MSREFTTQEIEQQFLENVVSAVKYWNRQPGENIEKLKGLAFSILVTIDGCSNLPRFVLAPFPHADDKQYSIDEGENYYPENNSDNIKSDISGALHEQISNYFK